MVQKQWFLRLLIFIKTIQIHLAVTTISYDIGLLDGIEQKISVIVYNIMGQHVTTLINNVSHRTIFCKVAWNDKLGKMVPSNLFCSVENSFRIIRNKNDVIKIMKKYIINKNLTL